jgi:hypothetical protein
MITAKITYQENGQNWTRGNENFMNHSIYGDYLYRNAYRIQEVFLVSIGQTEYNCVTSKKEMN